MATIHDYGRIDSVRQDFWSAMESAIESAMELISHELYEIHGMYGTIDLDRNGIHQIKMQAKRLAIMCQNLETLNRVSVSF